MIRLFMKSQEEINAIGKATAEHLVSTVFKLAFWIGLAYVVGTNSGSILAILALPAFYILTFFKDGRIIDGGLIDAIGVSIVFYLTVFGIILKIQEALQVSKKQKEYAIYIEKIKNTPEEDRTYEMESDFQEYEIKMNESRLKKTLVDDKNKEYWDERLRIYEENKKT